MTLYNVNMWLSVNSSDPAVLAQFELRFPRATERKWAGFALEADSQNHLAEKLNVTIFRDCEPGMRMDFEDPHEAVIFQTSGWQTGPGGAHSGNTVARVMSEGQQRDWTIGGGVTDPIIFAHVSFEEVQ